MTNSLQGEHAIELLEQAVALLAILVARSSPPGDEVTRKDQIVLLSQAGLKPKQVAELLGTTAGTVSVRLAEAKKSTKN
jgi:hypothetical protein